ncbi:hypothetical protein Godav_010678, partial [Gossypium davidsonii]|nr:hypothetical protein [Gossypium davidsonii]
KLAKKVKSPLKYSGVSKYIPLRLAFGVSNNGILGFIDKKMIKVATPNKMRMTLKIKHMIAQHHINGFMELLVVGLLLVLILRFGIGRLESYILLTVVLEMVTEIAVVVEEEVETLLGKQVDYSGRSVIVVGPSLSLHRCGLPREIAIELFQTFVIRGLIRQHLAPNIGVAKSKIREKGPI